MGGRGEINKKKRKEGNLSKKEFIYNLMKFCVINNLKKKEEDEEFLYHNKCL